MSPRCTDEAGKRSTYERADTLVNLNAMSPPCLHLPCEMLTVSDDQVVPAPTYSRQCIFDNFVMRKRLVNPFHLDGRALSE